MIDPVKLEALRQMDELAALADMPSYTRLRDELAGTQNNFHIHGRATLANGNAPAEVKQSWEDVNKASRALILKATP